MRPGEHIEMAKILVTGGCGFIGSHLCEALVARGDTVRVLDNLSSGLAANLAMGAELMHGDINRTADLIQALHGMDGCFHLAAVASVERCLRDWPGTHRTNLSATIALMNAACTHGIPVVYASSAAVYGRGILLPLDEGAHPLPLSSYGADKLGCEQHAHAGGQTHGLASAGLRFFNVYGPGQDPASPYSGVISIFCDRLRQGRTIDIHGDGSQTRDFIFVGDVVVALLAALPVASVAAPVLNVCTGSPTSILHLAEELAELCGVRAEVHQRPARTGDIAHSVGSPQLARRLLKLPRPLRLREGLRATLKLPGRTHFAPDRHHLGVTVHG
jgi:UDP-glucose 4-epimerase